MNYYTAVLTNYAGSAGRARRAEFWMFALINFIISLVLYGIGLAVGVGQLLEGIYSLAVFVPSLAVGARRLHDTDRSGWWLLVAFTVIGIVLLLYFYILDSQPGSNKYGPNPKGE